MTDDERHELTDEEVAALLAEQAPTIVWARVRDRRRDGVGDIRTSAGAEPATPEGIARVLRRLPGGANRGGRTKGTTVDEAGGDAEVRRIVAELRRNNRRVTLATVAAASGTFTRDNLRYWLGKNGKRLSDY